MDKNVLIETKELSKYYADGKVIALDKVSLRINQGEFLAIKGPSGSGKSTLLHLIGDLDKPTSGKMYFEGQDLNLLFRQSGFKIRNVGFVFQVFYLWSTMNVLQNILLPLVELNLSKKEKIQRADALIETVGLAQKRLAAVPELSVGERQRVAIARALVARPKLVLADEPTGSLDSKNAENILQLFKKINRESGTTIVMVTHERMSESFFDRSVEIFDGKIKQGKI
jgi:putative ABC transport system ATP-binding protein